ncbi:MAG: alpha-1,2-fucosyltransferase [Rhodobacteraceae bacterium]|nr:alpha-1,2-fucosyltransferase [Paracoccaceae bacterium]
MITTRLHGRLGNQMFQYAAAVGLAERLGTDVALDSREAQARGEGVLTRVFDLPVVAPRHLPPLKSKNPVKYGLWRKLGTVPKFQRETHLGYNTRIESLIDGAYLHGYWQSERYFAHSQARIRRDFAFPPLTETRNSDMAQRIQRCTSISLHVRRGDYLTLSAHVLCDDAYYAAALQKVADGLNDPQIFVFSDDPQWAKDNLPLPFPKTVVDFNGPETDFEDMRLMSMCQHNIIGNSSFSWWAAWLNDNPDKRVAGPTRWFGDPELHNPDILPEGWLKIQA